jgi:hypothetical protein
MKAANNLRRAILNINTDIFNRLQKNSASENPPFTSNAACQEAGIKRQKLLQNGHHHASRHMAAAFQV